MKTVPFSVYRYLFLAASPSFAQVTRIVDDDAQASLTSCDDSTLTFASVGAAIAAAAADDTVLVCPGTYVENINFERTGTWRRAIRGDSR